MTRITRRVRLKWDEDQSGPDHDAQMPVLYVEYRWGPTIVHGREYLPDAANLKAAWNYLDKDGFERWLAHRSWRVSRAPAHGAIKARESTPEHPR